jgi:hypothetical protein
VSIWVADGEFRLLQILQEILSLILEGVRVRRGGELFVNAERGYGVGGFGGDFGTSDGK